MKVLKKYLSKMSNERYVECQIILKLMKDGYNYKQAKQMFHTANILEIMRDNGLYFFHQSLYDWTKWIEEQHKDQYKKNTCFQIFLNKIFIILKIKLI